MYLICMDDALLLEHFNTYLDLVNFPEESSLNLNFKFVSGLVTSHNIAWNFSFV